MNLRYRLWPALIALALLAGLAGLAAGLSHTFAQTAGPTEFSLDVPWDPSLDEPCPAWQPPPSTSYRSFPNAGLYTFFDWPHLDPDVYPWLTGGHLVFTWRAVENRAQGDYYWEEIDQWMATEAALGKKVGLAFNTYEGTCCGGNQTPPWFRQAHGAWPGGDGYVTCSWSDSTGNHTEDIPMYWSQAYLADFERFIQAAAERYRDDPRLAFVEVSTGIYGETMPGESDGEVDQCLQDAGLTSDLWIEAMDRIVDIYQRHWHDTPLLTQYAPWYLYRNERRDHTDYAGSVGVGVKHNRLIVDHDDQVVRSDTATIHPAVCRTGQYDPMLEFAGQVPMGWEGTSVYHPEASDLLWSLLNGMNKHPTYLLLGRQTLQTSDPVRQWALRLADRYAGVSIDTTPGVWVALRDPKPPAPGEPPRWYPQWGNFDFWLTQDDRAPAGRTVPEWDVTDEPWGRYTRRTDMASGNRDMFFDVDDHYVTGSGATPVTVTVIYLDYGGDTWELEYDAVDDNHKSAGIVQKTTAGRWTEATFTLPDAQFAGQLDGYDFRIRSRGDGDEYVSFVEVVKGGELRGTGGAEGADRTQTVGGSTGQELDQFTRPPIYQSTRLPAYQPTSFPISQPPNDDFDHATPITAFPFYDTLDTAGATVAADDPDMGCGDGQNRRTLWYRFTAPGDGFVTVNTVGSTQDTVLAAWQGSRGQLAGRGCNDDGGWWSDTSTLNLGVAGGETYVIEVASRDLEAGLLSLRATFQTCSYYSGDETAVQGILDAYGLDGFDYWIDTVRLPNDVRCAVTGLRLANQELADPLPASVGNLRNLQTLDLHENHLPDPLPGSIGNLQNLQWLDLHVNLLQGPLPASLGNLYHLQALELSGNRLAGPVPDALRSLSGLQRLNLSNNQLTGGVTAWIGELANLEQLWLGHNRLSGPLPASLGSLDKLRELSLSRNQLDGTLPAELGNLQDLHYLYLGGNQFSGSLPATWTGLAQLQALYLDHNQLSGSLPPELSGLAQLELLDLSHNQLSGILPDSLGSLSPLRGLVLRDNQLTGDLPASLGNLTELRGLYLGQNPVGGSLPATLGALAELRRLSVEDTQLEGPLPLSLTGLGNLWSGDFRGTALCEPDDPAFQAWRAGVRYWQGSGLICGSGTTPTSTPTRTPTPTRTATPTPTSTSPPTHTPTPTPTPSPTATATPTVTSTPTTAPLLIYLPVILEQ